MTDFFQNLENFFRLFDPNAVPGVRVHTPTKHTSRGAVLVGPNPAPLSVRRGWSRRGNTWTGSYVTKSGATYDGKIERRGDVFEPYIRRPPEAVRGHSRFVCFHERSNGWWWVHLHTCPRNQDDPSAVIAYIERLLAEALNNRR